MSITKGKWEVVENEHFIDIKVDGNPIAQVVVNQYADVDKEQMRANARMMALAPEMFEFLESISGFTTFQGTPAWIYDMKKLLAKVKGNL